MRAKFVPGGGFPICLNCRRHMSSRMTEGGVPSVSATLNAIDKEYHFCTLRCAARYGVKRALETDGPATGCRAALRSEDERRKREDGFGKEFAKLRKTVRS